MSAPQQVQSNRLVAVINDENGETEALFQQFESGVSDPEEGRRLVGEIIYVLVRRVVLREKLVHPAIQRSLDDGEDVVDLEVLADDEVGRLLKLIADTPATSGTFEPLVARLIEQVRERMGDGRRTCCPDLWRRSAPRTRTSSGTSWRGPGTPRRPPPRAPPMWAPTSSSGSASRCPPAPPDARR